MIALGFVVWTLLALVVGAVIGAVISAADRHEQPAPIDTDTRIEAFL